MLKNTLARCLFALCLLTSACSSGEQTRAAREVLQLMRFDESLQLAVKYPPAKPRGVRDGEALNRCLMAYDTSKVFDEVVALYARHFTKEELAALATFYRSEAGQARVLWALSEGYLRRGLSSPFVASKPGATAEAAMAQFARTSAGQKMLPDAPLTQEVSELLQTESKRRSVECVRIAQAG